MVTNVETTKSCRRKCGKPDSELFIEALLPPQRDKIFHLSLSGKLCQRFAASIYITLHSISFPSFFCLFCTGIGGTYPYIKLCLLYSFIAYSCIVKVSNLSSSKAVLGEALNTNSHNHNLRRVLSFPL